MIAINYILYGEGQRKEVGYVDGMGTEWDGMWTVARYGDRVVWYVDSGTVWGQSGMVCGQWHSMGIKLYDVWTKWYGMWTVVWYGNRQ